jgi:uncharacterized protein (TIGR03435 family)
MRHTLMAAVLAAMLPAQSFDVASVKPVQSGQGAPSIAVSRGGRLTATNVTLRRLIRWAYNVQDFQIVGGPDFRNQPIYEIQAKGARGNENAEELARALQTVLTERFKLKIHRESKETSVYALTLKNNPTTLKEIPNGAEGPSRIRMNPCGVELTFPAGASLTQLSSFLSGQSWMERPVVDGTNLKGLFDIKLQFTVDGPISLADQGFESGAPPPAPGPTPDAFPCVRATLFEAVQAQLGLKLESTKAPVEMLVIDHWEPPSQN